MPTLQGAFIRLHAFKRRVCSRDDAHSQVRMNECRGARLMIVFLQGYSLSGGKSSTPEPEVARPAPKGPARPAAIQGSGTGTILIKPHRIHHLCLHSVSIPVLFASSLNSKRARMDV